MSNATVSAVTIRPAEATHFGHLAADWWDPNGQSAMLHRLNPVRLAYLRGVLEQANRGKIGQVRILEGYRALDVGCGAGLLTEPLARLGAEVTGVDAAAENIAVARDHACDSGLAVTYHHGDIAALDLGQFDLITAMEVIEHVADKPAFLAALARRLAPEGLLVMSTPNRTPQSRLLMIEGAERLGLIPRGTHHWEDFITPDELCGLLAEVGLTMGSPTGIAWGPAKGLHLSDNLALNYLVSATV